MRETNRKIKATGIALFYGLWSVVAAHGYSFNEIVPDVRESASLSGGSACPIPSHQVVATGGIAVQWSTALGTNPQTIFTSNQTPAGSLNEIEAVIEQSESVWSGVASTSLSSSTFAPVTRVATAKYLRRRWRQLHLLRSAGQGIHSRRSGVHTRDHRGRHRHSTGKRGIHPGWPDSGCGHLFQPEQFECDVCDTFGVERQSQSRMTWNR